MAGKQRDLVDELQRGCQADLFIRQSRLDQSHEQLGSQCRPCVRRRPEGLPLRLAQTVGRTSSQPGREFNPLGTGAYGRGDPFHQGFSLSPESEKIRYLCRKRLGHELGKASCRTYLQVTKRDLPHLFLLAAAYESKTDSGEGYSGITRPFSLHGLNLVPMLAIVTHEEAKYVPPHRQLQPLPGTPHRHHLAPDRNVLFPGHGIKITRRNERNDSIGLLVQHKSDAEERSALLVSKKDRRTRGDIFETQNDLVEQLLPARDHRIGINARIFHLTAQGQSAADIFSQGCLLGKLSLPVELRESSRIKSPAGTTGSPPGLHHDRFGNRPSPVHANSADTHPALDIDLIRGARYGCPHELVVPSHHQEIALLMADLEGDLVETSNQIERARLQPDLLATVEPTGLAGVLLTLSQLAIGGHVSAGAEAEKNSLLAPPEMDQHRRLVLKQREPQNPARRPFGPEPIDTAKGSKRPVVHAPFTDSEIFLDPDGRFEPGPQSVPARSRQWIHQLPETSVVKRQHPVRSNELRYSLFRRELYFFHLDGLRFGSCPGRLSPGRDGVLSYGIRLPGLGRFLLFHGGCSSSSRIGHLDLRLFFSAGED